MYMVVDDSVKVFCKKCKYYNRYSSEYCKRVLEVTKIVTPYEIKDVKTYARPDVDNRGNDCILYEYDILTKILELILTVVAIIIMSAIVLMGVSVT